MNGANSENLLAQADIDGGLIGGASLKVDEFPVKFVQRRKEYNNMLYEILIVIYLLVAIALIGFVLIQQGKGADMGASFGAGSSATIFGSSGSGNF